MAAIHLPRPRRTERDDATVVEFKTPEGEVLTFEGVSDDEVKAKAHDYLAWAS